jgi:hypothetical protein
MLKKWMRDFLDNEMETFQSNFEEKKLLTVPDGASI